MAGPPTPLDGIRVLDLSRVLSGPHCGRVLSDLGADVIKLEAPEGDLTRTAQPRVAGLSVYFTQQNCGKRNVSIDLRQPAGAALALDLAAACDVVLENFRPGVMDRLGLGYQAVRARNHSVVYCSITGYGQDGPAARRRAYAPMMHAEAGLMELSARLRGTEPLPETISHGDLYAGLQAAVGVLAALRHRERTGEGQHVDVSMAESLLGAIEWTAVELAGGDRGLPHVFGGHKAPVLQLGDGSWVCVPGDPVASFPAWCTAMERPELLADERFATPVARQDHEAEMREVLREWAAGFERVEDLEPALGRGRLAVGRVRSVSEVAEGEWASTRGAFAEVDDRAGATLRVPRGPWRFSGLEAGVHGVAAYRGEHNRQVLAELLGLDDDAIGRLEADGVLSSRPPPGSPISSV